MVLVSGDVLLFAGPSARATWFPIHKESFFVWVAFTALHVIGHLPAMPRALRADYGRSPTTAMRIWAATSPAARAASWRSAALWSRVWCWRSSSFPIRSRGFTLGLFHHHH